MEFESKQIEEADTTRDSDTQAPDMLGEFELVRELGRGGMGQVYEAQHRRHQGRVALKRLLNLSPGSVQAFHDEFRALREISHRNLVRLLELDANAGEPFFTMELISGVNFLEFIRAGFDSQDSETPVLHDAARLADALRQIAEGVLALHRANKLHRDVKPSNVLVTSDGRVVLIDFGLAVDVDQDAALYRNSMQERWGTSCYMSPEQHAGQPLSFSSDWYSVGVLLFEALSGQVPFEGGTLSELQARKLALDRPAPHDLAPHVPAELNDLCVRLLAPIPQDRPSGTEILAMLGGLAPTPSEPRRVWVGREECLEPMHAALADVKQGVPTTLLVSGPPGAGKSALVDHFLETIRHGQRQFVVLRGRCHENESIPWKGFDTVVKGLSRYLRSLKMAKAEACLTRDKASLGRIFPVLLEVPAVRHAGTVPEMSGPDAKELRRRGLAAFCDTLGRLSDMVELIIYVDDLQWGDADTAVLFEHLTRLTNKVRCLMIGAFRDGEEARTSDCVRAIRDLEPHDDQPREFARQRHIEVDWLTAQDAARLAVELIGDHSDSAVADARMIAEESGGSPLYVKFLAQHRDALRTNNAEGQQLSLEQLLWQLIFALPPESRAVVELVAIAGRPVSRQLIYQATGSRQDPALLLHELLAARLIRVVKGSRRDEIEAYHDRIRETVENRLAPPQQAERAGQLADVVISTGDAQDPEFTAMLLARAGRPAEAGKYYWQAANRARDQLAFARAADLYKSALESLPLEGDDELRLRENLAKALAHAGRGSEAGEQYVRASQLAEGNEHWDLLCQAALRYLTSGHVDLGLDALKQVLSAVGMPLPRTPQGAYISSWLRRWGFLWNGLRITPASDRPVTPRQRQLLNYSWSAAAGLSVVDPIRAVSYVSRNVAISLRSGDPKLLGRALTAQVGHVAAEGDGRRGEITRLLRALRRVAKVDHGPYARALRELARGISSHLLGRWQAASKSCDRAAKSLSDPRCQDIAWELDTAQTFALWALLYQGDIAELTRRQPELQRIARENNDLFGMLNFGSVVMTLVQLGANQPDTARRRLEEERPLLSTKGFFVQNHNWLLGRTLLELFEGQPQAAWQEIADKWASYKSDWLSEVEQVKIDFHQVQGRAAVAVAACEHASVGPGPAQRIVRVLERQRAPWAKAIAKLLRGGLATIHDERTLAVEEYERAVQQLDAVHMHLHAAAARCRLGQLCSDERGREYDARGRESMARLGVTNIESMVQAMAPGKF